MNQPVKSSSSTSRGPGNRHVAVVSSRWHAAIIGNALAAIKDEFARCGFPADHLEFFDVPGAFEIPLHAMKLAESGRYEAIVACGLVVDSGIYRHEFVASAVIDGLMQVQLRERVPVFSAVLTPKDFHAHEDHVKFFSAHFSGKGTEVARACIETVASLAALPETCSRDPGFTQ